MNTTKIASVITPRIETIALTRSSASSMSLTAREGRVVVEGVRPSRGGWRTRSRAPARSRSTPRAATSAPSRARRSSGTAAWSSGVGAPGIAATVPGLGGAKRVGSGRSAGQIEGVGARLAAVRDPLRPTLAVPVAVRAAAERIGIPVGGRVQRRGHDDRREGRQRDRPPVGEPDDVGPEPHGHHRVGGGRLPCDDLVAARRPRCTVASAVACTVSRNAEEMSSNCSYASCSKPWTSSWPSHTMRPRAMPGFLDRCDLRRELSVRAGAVLQLRRRRDRTFAARRGDWSGTRRRAGRRPGRRDTPRGRPE